MSLNVQPPASKKPKTSSNQELHQLERMVVFVLAMAVVWVTIKLALASRAVVETLCQ